MTAFRWIVQAMMVELKRDMPEITDLHTLSPHQVKELLYNILTRNNTQADLRYCCQDLPELIISPILQVKIAHTGNNTSSHSDLPVVFFWWISSNFLYI